MDFSLSGTLGDGLIRYSASEVVHFCEGVLHAIDCRDNRQAGADTTLDHRYIAEVVSTNRYVWDCR